MVAKALRHLADLVCPAKSKTLKIGGDRERGVAEHDQNQRN